MVIKRADVKQVIREVLLADAGVQAIVGDNVFGAHIDDPDRATVLQDSPMVVFSFLSGFTTHAGATSRGTFEMYGWSKQSQDEATRAYDAAKNALQAALLAYLGVPACGTSREVEEANEGFNAKDRSWFIRGRWIAMMKVTTT